MWFEASVAASVAKAGNQALTKLLVQTEGVLTVAAIGQILAGLMLIPFFFVPDLLHFPANPEFHRDAWISILLNVVVVLFLVQAIRCSDLSIALPFLALSPAFTILSSRLMRGEVIAPSGLLGIALIVAGALTVDAVSLRDALRMGGARVFRDRGVQLVTAVSCIWAFSAVLDKNATLLSSPLDFVVYSTVARAVIFAGILAISWHRLARPLAAAGSSRSARLRIVALYLLLGFTFNVETLLHIVAISMGLVALVVSIKRLSILITSVVGMVFFGEPRTLARLVGAAMMVAGSAVIYWQNG